MPRITDEQEHQAEKLAFKYSKVNQSKLLKQSGKLPGNLESGIVVLSIGKNFIVQLTGEEAEKGRQVECVTAGRIRSANLNSSMVAVGDSVGIILARKKSGEETGKIVFIGERRNCFSRKAVAIENREHIITANIDKVLIFVSTTEPAYNRRFIDRLLVAAELNGIEPAICINKIDLFDCDELRNDFSIYSKLDIKLFFISALFGTALEDLTEFLNDSLTLLAGPSGTGKSTLINKLIGSEIQKVTEISDKWGKGKHTTSAARMIELPSSGTIVDTPGLREFALWGISKQDLPLYFHDFDDYNKDCKYFPCSHTHEPDCAVKKAYEDEKLDPQRYESYLNIYDTLED
jgi:ribosome biogenesis GTPase